MHYIVCGAEKLVLSYEFGAEQLICRIAVWKPVPGRLSQCLGTCVASETAKKCFFLKLCSCLLLKISILNFYSAIVKNIYILKNLICNL